MSGTTKLLIACLSLYAPFPETQAIDNNNTIEPKLVKSKMDHQHGVPNTFKYFSFIVEANPKPKVYGCSYLYTGNGTTPDETCFTMIKNGTAQALDAQDTSNTSLRSKYYPQSTIASGTFWYMYEVPTSCWRTQRIYATIDDQNYTSLLHYDPADAIKQKPTIRKADISETTKCLSLEVDAIENGNCADVVYVIDIEQFVILEKHTYSMKRQTLKFNGTLSNLLVKYEHCSIISMPNTTINDTNTNKLLTVKSNNVFLDVQAIIGGINGSASDVKSFSLPADGENGGGNNSGGMNCDGDMLGTRKLVYFVPLVMILIQGYML